MKKLVKEYQPKDQILFSELTGNEIIAYRTAGIGYLALLVKLHNIEHTTVSFPKYGFVYTKLGTNGPKFTGKTKREAIENAMKAGREVLVFYSEKEFLEEALRVATNS